MAAGALVWIAGAAALLLLFGMLHARYDSANAVAFARTAFADLQGDAQFHWLTQQGEEAFVDYYLKVRRWRAPLYVAGYGLLAIFATVIALLIADLFRRFAYPGPLVWQFLTFFGVITSWVVALALTLWAYQARKSAALLWWRRRIRV